MNNAGGRIWQGWTPMVAGRSAVPTLAYGDGCKVWDTGGRSYLDGVAAANNAPFGHRNKYLSAAVAAQMQNITNFELSLASTIPVARLGIALGSISPRAIERFVLVNSGSEAIECAIRIAVDYWRHRGDDRKDVIIAFERGYHGSTALAQMLSGLPFLKSDWCSGLDIRHVSLESLASSAAEACSQLAGRFETVAESAGRERIAAIIVEPFLNVGGGIVLPSGFLPAIRSTADALGALLVLDEVFTGFGRSGDFFASVRERIDPDVLVMSKGMTGGYVPMGAVGVTVQIHDAFLRGPMDPVLRYGHTTSGHALACAAALASIDLLKDHEGTVGRLHVVDWLGRHFDEYLRPLDGVDDVRTYGVAGVVEMSSEERSAQVVLEARSIGLLIRRQGRAIMLVPPLIVSEPELVDMVEMLILAVKSCRRS